MNLKNIEIRHLRYFLAVAEELNFRKASENLFISQPGLSKQIANLEEELGFKLFERNNRNVKLTSEGEYLQKEIGLILKSLEGTLSHTKLMSEGLQGTIRMGYVGSAMQNVIPELLLNLKNSLPKIRFTLKERDNSAQVRALKNGEIDLGFVRLNQVPKPLILKPVLNDTFSLVLPSKHSISQSNFTSLAQLKEESFILFEEKYSSIYYQNVMSIFEEAEFAPTISHNTVHANTIFRLVENGFGVSIVPTSLKNGYDMKIQFIELREISQRAVLSAVWNGENRNPALEKILKWL
ncbi:MAG: DNA-binding transcriptional LysR family regulator [Flammeovirgaceae bacterium]|jgi:DNA-binding transcriptional LysR family regulator